MAAPIRLSPIFSAAFEKFLCFSFLALFISACDNLQGSFLCRKCGFEISEAQDLFIMPSKLALGRRNDTIALNQRAHIQLFKNPQGAYFELLTSLAANVEADSVSFVRDSWFPGFGWSIAKCPRCGSHVGCYSGFDIEMDVVKFGPVVSHVHYRPFQTAMGFCLIFNAAKGAYQTLDSKVTSFVGLILDKVMHEDEVQSLIIKPKVYYS